MKLNRFGQNSSESKVFNIDEYISNIERQVNMFNDDRLHTKKPITPILPTVLEEPSNVEASKILPKQGHFD